ncbi:glycerophosphodiester phosphodiesterase family protein [Falsirhodobacter xinxiangensis]|uniref:glycerophosphodiester phosphodiesterase family protein n=1 Tax=Falsirhodobacter xinxiangensis TaxID=2530049 RepID=UPI0010A99C65|nr:glycerophosphodiester phosphodiesterase family protein [Rhodobacter xinxiangensis]
MKHLPHVAGGALMALALSAPFAQSATVNTLSGNAPAVIAHRGAAAYLPENSTGAYELGAFQGAEYIETDVMMSSDGVGIIMHDATLDRTTNVEELFAPRNGGYAVGDFTAAEIQTLTAQPTGPADWTYPGFTPSHPDPYRVTTFAEFLDNVTAYNEANGTNVGIVVEAKEAEYRPDMNRHIAETLAAKGFTGAEDNVILQAFSFQNTAELADLANEFSIDAGIHQLGSPGFEDGEYGVNWAGTFLSLLDLSAYVDSVAVHISDILGAEFVSAAHDLGLGVNVWTLRPTSLEEAFAQIQPLIDIGVDGIITDNPDYARAVVDSQVPAPVPVPAALPMLVGGLIVLGGLARRRKH